MSNLPQEIQDRLESSKTYRTFPHVIKQTIDELRDAEMVLRHIETQLRSADPEKPVDQITLSTFAAILAHQQVVLTERADLLIDTCE